MSEKRECEICANYLSCGCTAIYPCVYYSQFKSKKKKIIKSNIFNEIKLERIRQNLKHPKDDYSPVEWLPVLVEEVGEVSKAILENNFSNDKDNYREELIHVAAVAVRMIESFDRGNR